MLEIENLKFGYKNKEVLKNINLYIKHRDFLGIIGPNGSGKSTLLKNISRIVCPNKGVVYLDDRLLQEYNNRDLAKKMAVVPQDTTLNFNFNVYDIIMMGRNPYQNRWGNISEEDKKVVKEAMCLTDTYFLRDKNINNLSGGERQRVIIARALAQKPDLLLLDEPTSSLDINYQGEIFDLLTDLNQNLDLTIIVVSHDLNLSSQYCDELILLYEGEIFEAGTPEEVLTPQNIKAVYKTEVIIKENPLTDRPYVTLIPRDYQQKCNLPGHKERIHVIAGGGAGKELLKLLHRNGYRNVS
ncbi:MAG: ABC transporter ATP-binding protein, partial [Halanaerobiales bacterium]